MPGPSFVDLAGDFSAPGAYNGRFINPPFLFGSGVVELVAKEMTRHLQRIKKKARVNPHRWFKLKTKGVNFGEILAHEDGSFDTSRVEGIDEDCVVRPFGRKGEFATFRDFALNAMQFHFGMQPTEVVGDGVDADGDGFTDEILVGEASALHIWGTTLSKPIIEGLTEETWKGFRTFRRIGCASCHKPFFRTQRRMLTYSYPEIATKPFRNVYFQVDLVETANVIPSRKGGLKAALFLDFKRHDMGPELAENLHTVATGSNRNREFITARLWGIADTAPYLHDGRATTITDAILAHGGEAIKARNRFLGLSQGRKHRLLAFLYSLRTPLDGGQVGSGEDLLSADD